MITSQEEYLKHLLEIQNNNFPLIKPIIPTDEIIYNIDLNKRTIESPEFLGVSLDQKAETVYFKIDRYFDNTDLTTTVCLVQYINKNAKDSLGYAYLVPYYDTETYVNEDKILIPWTIAGSATATPGPIEFAIKFYLLNEDGTKYIYNLNTQVAKSKILEGMNVITEENEDLVVPETALEFIYSEIKSLRDNQGITWIDLF